MSAMKDHRLERTIFFSDAVIAIAITLLIIEIKIPELPRGDFAAGVKALEILLPSFFAFLLSFLSISRFWLAHSAALGGMSGYDPRLERANLYFLLIIAVMPFASGFLARNLGETVPALFYNGTLALGALVSLWLVFIATDAKSGHSQHQAEESRGLTMRAKGAVAVAVLSVGLAFIAPLYSQIPLLALVAGDRLIARKFV